jgi:pSer/pThr/pTyr-binding forkhead associated (FHA) protein
MPYCLVIRNGKNAGKRIALPPQGELLIGRGAECRLRLASTDVSRKHCRLIIQEDQVIVEDLKSQNGTFLDGYLIQAPVPLRADALLRIGPLEFQFAKTSSGKKPRASASVDADEIAAWLTEEGETDEVNLEDSTIIPPNIASRETREVDSQETQHELPNRIELHPDADDAAEIIRQHWNAKQQS